MSARHCELRIDGNRALNDEGAVAVEFAFVLPLLVMLLMGIIEFGRGYNAKIELTGAVREGARQLAVGKTTVDAELAVIDGAPGLTLTSSNLTTSACAADGTGSASVTATYPVPYSIPFVFSGTWDITVTAVMRCGV